MTFFFFTTKLLDVLGAEAYADALAKHRRLLREAFTAHGGTEVDTQGDAFFVAFPTATGAIEAAAPRRRLERQARGWARAEPSAFRPCVYRPRIGRLNPRLR